MSQNQSDVRDCGLSAVGKVLWGTHFCQFYQTQKDLLDILIPYFKAGLLNNEFCIWVTSEFLTKEDALKALEKNIPEFSKYIRSGQIEVFPYTDWYLKKGKFELRRVLNDWITKYKKGLSAGFSGLRVSGDPFWIDNKKDWDDFTSYEAEINNVIVSLKMLVLCTYCLDRCRANEVIDVVTNHQFALIKRSEKWEIIESVQQKKAEEALRQSELQLKSAQRIAKIGSWELDLITNNLVWSDEVFRIFEIDRSKFGASYKAFLDLVHPEDRKEADKAYSDSLKTKMPYNIVHRLKFPDGHIKHVREICETFFNSKGEPVRSVGSVQDITEQKILEQRKDEFISIASHELKTPITTIKAYTHILNKYCTLSGDQKHLNYISKLEFQVERLSKLVSQLLDTSRIQYGKLGLIKERFDFAALVKDVAEDMQQTALNYKITVKGEFKKQILADKHRISQVLVNLISNAIKYSPNTDKVVIRLFSDNKSVGVKVQDYGIGIKKEELNKIFERFYQVENSIRSSNGGLGLGLYLSRNIIEQHKGELWVTSKEGRGCTFSFKIPLE